MNWYYAKNGAQQGPLPTEDMKSRIAMGEIAPTDLAWSEGMADWTPVGEIPQLKLEAPSSAGAYTPVAAPVSSGAPTPYQAPMSAPSSAVSSGQAIPSYLWQSIVVTIFCCWPFGIPAIVFAAKVEGLKGRGDFAAAKQASDNAKKWCIVSLVLGLIVIALYIALMATGVMTEIQSQQPTRGLPSAP